MRLLRASFCTAAVLLLLAPSALAHDPRTLTEPALPGFGGHGLDDPFAFPLMVPPLPGSDTAAEGEYTMEFVCPSIEQGAEDSYSLRCPLYILDQEDLIAQPVLLVDPIDADLVGFNGLHGGHGYHPLPDNQPPTERSRDDSVHQPHTTFRTSNGGLRWNDNPYYAPDHLQGGGGDGIVEESRQVFGEDNAAALDAEGRLYLASLYAHRDSDDLIGGTLEPFQHTVQTWKGDRLNREVDYFSNSRAIDSGNDGLNVIDSIHAVYVPETDLVVVLWRESVPEGGIVGGLEEGPDSFVRVFYTHPHEGAMWYELEDNAIGPCRGISNPITYGGELYIGCFPDEGYAHAASYNLQVHAIDTYSWTTRHIAGTPVQSGHPLLVADRKPGDMTLIASGLNGNGQPEVVITRGEEGARWSSLERVQDDLTPGDSRTIKDVRVTAAAVSHQSDNLHLIYTERYELSEAQISGSEMAYFKTLAAFAPGDRFLTKLDLDMAGQGWASLDPFLTGGPEAQGGVFDGLRDGIVVWTDPVTGQQREFIGYADHGYFRFAEIAESDFLPAIPIPSTGVPPIPAPAAGLNPATQAALAGLLSLTMLSRMLLAKKKVTTEAPEL